MTPFDSYQHISDQLVNKTWISPLDLKDALKGYKLLTEAQFEKCQELALSHFTFWDGVILGAFGLIVGIALGYWFFRVKK